MQQNQASAISGVSLAESGATAGESFTVTLADTDGRLSATGSGVSGSGTTSLSITGPLSQLNSDLATLTDTDAATAADTIAINASDSFSNKAAPQSIAVNVSTQSGTPTITAPASATVGIGQSGAIGGVSIAETPTASGETFTAALADTNGVLAANTGAAGGGGTITPSNGGTSLTITGTLAQVNADLTTLTDNDPTAGSDQITVNASDSNGGKATPAAIAVTVNGLPVTTTPTSATVTQNQASPISGVSLSESGNTAGESFTVTLADTDGKLSATGSGVSGSGTTSLSITGSLGQVNSDLATLTDTDAATAADTITLNASDSFGNKAAPQPIAVSVSTQSGTPAITAPASATVGVVQPGAIGGVSIAETPTTSGESFTTVLADTNGVPSANTGAAGGGGTITPSNGGATLTIAGTLAQVNADLTSLTDNDPTAGADQITINVSDSNGGKATAATIAVTVNGLPVITAPSSTAVQHNQATAIAGVSLAESGNTSAPETFTVTLADTDGKLSATGSGVSGSGTTSLLITGPLSQVNSDLATLTDTDAATAADAITVNASDSFGGPARQLGWARPRPGDLPPVHHRRRQGAVQGDPQHLRSPHPDPAVVRCTRPATSPSVLPSPFTPACARPCARLGNWTTPTRPKS